jgi:hypothetical protein
MHFSLFRVVAIHHYLSVLAKFAGPARARNLFVEMQQLEAKAGGGHDWLADLPDDALRRVLFFMPAREACRPPSSLGAGATAGSPCLLCASTLDMLAMVREHGIWQDSWTI